MVGESGIPFEVQIRTKEMHEVAEYGVAAHWKYKQNGQGAGDERSYEWVRRLLENQEDADAEDFIHSLKVDMFADEVFVFTPNGDVINLRAPRPSTLPIPSTPPSATTWWAPRSTGASCSSTTTCATATWWRS